MRSFGLLFKVLWSPSEAMFLLSKTSRAGTVFGIFFVYAVCRLLLASLRGF